MELPSCVALVTASHDEINSGGLSNLLDSFTGQDVAAIVLIREGTPEDQRSLQSHPNIIDVTIGKRMGISEARNSLIVQLLSMKPDPNQIVTFPDDDARYPPNFIESVTNRLGSNGLLLCTYGPQGSSDSSFTYPLTARIVFQAANSIGIVVRLAHLLQVGGFDESLGVGSGQVEAAEDLDILMALLRHTPGIWAPEIRAIHPKHSPRENRRFAYVVVARRYARASRFARRTLARGVIRILATGKLTHFPTLARAIKNTPPERHPQLQHQHMLPT